MSPDEKTMYQQIAEEKLRKLKTRITALENQITKKEADIEQALEILSEAVDSVTYHISAQPEE
jgi:hypothetical protein